MGTTSLTNYTCFVKIELMEESLLSIAGKNKRHSQSMAIKAPIASTPRRFNDTWQDWLTRSIFQRSMTATSQQSHSLSTHFCFCMALSALKTCLAKQAAGDGPTPKWKWKGFPRVLRGLPILVWKHKPETDTAFKVMFGPAFCASFSLVPWSFALLNKPVFEWCYRID